MRKITSLLMMLCMFVGAAWAQLPEITTDISNPIYYTIYNTRSQQPGGLMYFAGENVGIKDGCTSLSIEDKYKFFFTGSHDALYVHNAAAPGLKLAKIGNGNKESNAGAWTETGAEWQVVTRGDGNLAFGKKGATTNANDYSWWNECNYSTGDGSPDFTSWTSGDAGSAFVIEPAESHIFPETDKFYIIECPLFFSKQGIQKGLYVNGEGALGWNTVDLTDKKYYWVPTVNNDGTVTLKNLGTGKYLNGTEMSDATTNASLNYLGAKNFNIVVNNVTMHASGHGNGLNASGSIVNYGGVIGSASAWTFVERENPDAVQKVTVKYSFVYGGEEKYRQKTATLVGEEYPAFTIEFPYSVSAVKPAGVIEAGDVVDGTVTKTIELAVNLPFVPAADYASIKNWYYIQMHSSGGSYSRYIQAMDSYIEWFDVDMNASEVDSYTWGFIGNPFDGFKLVNYANGNTKGVNANASADPVINPAMGDIATATAWTLKPSASNPTAEYFCFQYPGSNQYMNAQSGKIAFWGDNDEGSTLWVTERDLTGRKELQALVDAIEAAAPNYVAGEGIGYHTQASVDAVAAAVAAAKTALAGTMTGAISAQHQTAINNAVAALVVNMPTPGALYRIKNVMRERFVSVDATGNRVPSEENNANASLIWTVEKKGDVYTIKNLNYGDNGYMKAVNDNQLTNAQEAASYSLVPFGEGQFKLTNSGTNFVDYGGDKGLGYWGSASKGGDGAWYFIPATELEVEVTAEYGSIYLPFDVTLADDAKAYAVTATSADYATLAEKEDIPAGEGAILAQGSYTLNIAEATSDWSANMLEGTNVKTPVKGSAYVLANGSNGVGLYKAMLNKDANGADVAEGGTHFINNANKAYLPVASEAAVLKFNFGGNTTAIESVVAPAFDANAPIYDLSGRRVMNAVKGGLYIQNGKKFIVK